VWSQNNPGFEGSGQYDEKQGKRKMVSHRSNKKVAQSKPSSYG